MCLIVLVHMNMCFSVCILYIVYVSVEFYKGAVCGGGECVSELCLFFRGEGCIYMCVCVGDGQIAHCIFTKYVWAGLWCVCV